MTADETQYEQLARLLLSWTEPKEEDPSPLADDTLAMLESDTLSEAETAELRQVLAKSPAARRQVSDLLRSEAKDGPNEFVQPRKPPAASATWTVVAVVATVAGLAASLLFVALQFFSGNSPGSGPNVEQTLAQAGTMIDSGQSEAALALLRPLLKSPPPEHKLDVEKKGQQAIEEAMIGALEQGHFQHVAKLAEEAKQLGIHSSRLASLHSQSVLGQRTTLALATAGRLDDFGVMLQSPRAKSIPTEAAELSRARSILHQALEKGQSRHREAVLNLAHAYLINEPDRAAQLFDELLSQDKRDQRALLGMGLALYLNAQFTESAETFARLLEEFPDDLDARINYALALESAGRKQDAVAQWQQVAKKHPDTSVREKVNIRLGFLMP